MATRLMVPGTSVLIQLNERGRGPGEDVPGFPWTGTVGLRLGQGTTYRCQDNSVYWFHLPITLPVPIDVSGGNPPITLTAVFLLFTADAGVALDSIHVFSSNQQVWKTQDHLGFSGDRSRLVQNVTVFSNLSVQIPAADGAGLLLQSLTVSGLFTFLNEANVTIIGGGCDVSFGG
jgi:hypothetical protein